MARVRKEEGADGDDDIHHDTQYALQIIRLAIAEEGANYEHCKNKGDGIKYGEIVIHVDM